MRTDPDRLAQLKQLLILDTAPEVAYDDLTQALSKGFGVPIAMVNLLDAERDWFKSCVGLPLTQSPVSTSFCETFFGIDDDWLVVEDTRADSRFAQHPLVTGAPFVRFYAAARLVVSDQTVGTLCAYDTQPRKVTPAQVAELQALARAAIEQLWRRRSAA